MKGKLLTTLASILSVLILAGSVSAFTVTVTSPTNNTEWFNQIPFDFLVTTNSAAQVCNVIFADNPTVPFALGNSTSANTTWMNVTGVSNTSIPFIFNATDNGSPARNFTVKCDTFWSNSSAAAGTTVYKINERTPGSITFTPNFPTYANNSEYRATSFVLNFSTSASVASCQYMIENQTLFTATNYATNTKWVNSSDMTITKSNGYANRNATMKCLDAFGNVSWMNSSSLAGFYIFKINEKAANTISISFPFISNASNYSYAPFPNVLLNTTATTCAYGFNGAVATTSPMSNSSNSSYFINTSSVTGVESQYHGFNNVTAACTDTWGNSSSFNLTNVSLRFFREDTVSPTIAMGIYNQTVKSAQSVWNFTFNFTDVNPNYCGLRYYTSPFTDNSTGTEILGSNVQQAADGLLARANCTLLFSPDSVTLTQGQFRLQAFGNDTFGHNTVGTNFTGVATKMVSAQWNLITFTGANSTFANMTVSEFVSLNFANASQVAIFNNTNGSFSTYSTSVSSINSGLVLYPGLAIYVYTAGNNGWLINPDFTPTSGSNENITLAYNDTVKGTPWNTFGLTQNATMNTTLYSCNAGLAGNVTTLPASCSNAGLNITWAAWYNASSGQFITCKRGVTTCSGTSLAPINITLPAGSALWVQVNGNITVNRTTISG